MTHIFPSCSWSILTLNNIHYRPIVALPPIHNFGVSSCQLTGKKSPVTKGLFTWARSNELARFPRSRLTSKPFVKFLMGSYERAGWLSSRDLGFPTGTSLRGLKILPYEHFSPVTGNESGMNFSQQRMRHMVDNVTRTRSQDLRPFSISETGVKFCMWTQGEIGPSQPGSFEKALSFSQFFLLQKNLPH